MNLATPPVTEDQPIRPADDKQAADERTDKDQTSGIRPINDRFQTQLRAIRSGV